MAEQPAKRARTEEAVGAPGNALEALKAMTVIVADTGDLGAIKKCAPEDATTNPSLLLQFAGTVEGGALLDKAVEAAKTAGGAGEELVTDVCDRFAVMVGCEILRLVPGLVSTEVDADLSFDKEATLRKARKLMALYEEAGVDAKSRVLIKLGSTWESIEACRKLQEEGIRCNMTLILSFVQAVAAAEAGATLISPFVGRILDWYKKTEGREFTAEEDPGVLSVRKVYGYYKAHGHKTVVMGASFRTTDEILALAGCDKLTIAPKFIEELKGRPAAVERRLCADEDHGAEFRFRLSEGDLTESQFRFHLNEDAMATEKLAEGIRGFIKDLVKLKVMVRTRLAK